MPKHTPGPWEWCESESGIYGNVRRYSHKGIEHVSREQVYPFFCEDRKLGLHGQRHEADKRLIAAAPELLQALSDCVTNVNATAIAQRDIDYMLRRFRAINEICQSAISKATGE